MDNVEKYNTAQVVINYLEQLYPEAECALEHRGDPFKLLVMARLSAQCTDKRVNEVCVGLFEKYPNAAAMMNADISDIEDSIRSCGLYRTKAQSLHDIAFDIVHKFNGKVPNTMEELLSMNGVGRKIGNLILGDCFGIDGIVCDTHCIRITNRLGLADSDYPDKVEKQLTEVIPDGKRSDFCHRIVNFGREICTARSPKCNECGLSSNCKFFSENRK